MAGSVIVDVAFVVVVAVVVLVLEAVDGNVPGPLEADGAATAEYPVGSFNILEE